jgi:hypothetical protein
MTPAQITDVTRRARMDAQAVLAWWPYRGCPFYTEAEVALYNELFKKAIDEARGKK